MKIGIMTNKIGHNYGGILQNYALQEVLRRLGHNPSTIRWWAISWRSYFRMLLSSIRRNVFSKHPWPIKPSFIEDNQLGIWKFINKRIKVAKLIYSYDLNTFSKKFDAIIVGSDQVWRPRYIQNVEMMFLDFVSPNVKKIAYSASFGTDSWEFTQKQTQRCSKLIQRFNSVSVREESAIKLCNNYLNYENVYLTLDPTLLLESSDYKSLIKASKQNQNNLFIYILDNTSKYITKVNELNNYLSLSISFKEIEDTLNEKDTIEGWIQEFVDAKYVITDSFHGCVFSIIFNIPFLVVENSVRGTARIDSILNQLNLKGRKISNIEEINIQNLLKPIDWESVNKKLQVLKEESLSFLRTALDN